MDGKYPLLESLQVGSSARFLMLIDNFGSLPDDRIHVL